MESQNTDEAADSAVAAAAPCSAGCTKCGSNDVYRRYYDEGSDTNGVAPNRNAQSTEWVNRREAYIQRALKDVIVHKCRCCGYSWDSDPLPNDPSVPPADDETPTRKSDV